MVVSGAIDDVIGSHPWLRELKQKMEKNSNLSFKNFKVIMLHMYLRVNVRRRFAFARKLKNICIWSVFFFFFCFAYVSRAKGSLLIDSIYGVKRFCSHQKLSLLFLLSYKCKAEPTLICIGQSGVWLSF